MDPETSEFDEVIESLNSLPFLETIARFKRGTKLFSLNNTSYILAADKNGISWRQTQGTRGIINRVITFEDVFENSPIEIQESLAFHLDLFKE